MRTKELFLFFFLLLQLGARAQHAVVPGTHLTKDSLSYSFTEQWYYYPSAAKGDSAFGANGWTAAVSYWMPDGRKKRVDKSGWWRLPFTVDSTLVSKPLALRISQHGASEIYLDGVLLRQLGSISPEGKCLRHFVANNIPI